MALSDLAIRNAIPRERPFKLTNEHGLSLIVNPNGSRWWRLRYCVGGPGHRSLLHQRHRSRDFQVPIVEVLAAVEHPCDCARSGWIFERLRRLIHDLLTQLPDPQHQCISLGFRCLRIGHLLVDGLQLFLRGVSGMMEVDDEIRRGIFGTPEVLSADESFELIGVWAKSWAKPGYSSAATVMRVE